MLWAVLSPVVDHAPRANLAPYRNGHRSHDSIASVGVRPRARRAHAFAPEDIEAHLSAEAAEGRVGKADP